MVLYIYSSNLQINIDDTLGNWVNSVKNKIFHTQEWRSL